MVSLVSIDPGKKACAWAVFQGEKPGYLRACGYGAFAARPLVCEELAHLAPIVVVEKPQIYDVSRWKGDPNDLIDVAIAGAQFAQVFKGMVMWTTPASWKGQRPKPVVHRRVRLVLDRGETVVLGAWKGTKKQRLDVLDAIGIGLDWLGRLWQ